MGMMQRLGMMVQLKSPGIHELHCVSILFLIQQITNIGQKWITTNMI